MNRTPVRLLSIAVTAFLAVAAVCLPCIAWGGSKPAMYSVPLYLYPSGQALILAATRIPGGAGADGAGDVVGPGSSTDNAIALFDGTTGKLLKNSLATVDATGGIHFDGTLVSDVGGGNARGANAVDLQTSRTLATQVASGISSVVTGGNNNVASGFSSVVGGGDDNTASGAGDNVVGGGFSNNSSGTFSTISGGQKNTAVGFNSAIGGGESNTTPVSNATVGGGDTNSASGTGSTVGGGVSNTASGISSAIPGGENNVASGRGSFAAGIQCKATQSGAFCLGDNINVDKTNSVTDSILFSFAGGTRVERGPITATHGVDSLTTNSPGNPVNGSAAAPPTVGQVPTATSATTFTWQTPSFTANTDFAEVTVDTTTTLTTFVDLLTTTLTTGASDILINASVASSNAMNNEVHDFRILIDAVVQRGFASSRGTASVNGQGTGIVLRRSVTAATHTIKLQWKVSGGTAQVEVVTTPDSEHASLYVQEL